VIIRVHIACTLATGCAHARMYVQFVHVTLRNVDGGVQLVYESTFLLGVGVILTEGKIGVMMMMLIVSFLFLTQVGVYVDVCVCIHTHTHTLHRWGTCL